MEDLSKWQMPCDSFIHTASHPSWVLVNSPASSFVLEKCVTADGYARHRKSCKKQQPTKKHHFDLGKNLEKIRSVLDVNSGVKQNRL